MTPIKPKRYRKSKRGFLVLLVIVALVIGFGGYVYLVASGIINSSEMHASNNDYFIYWTAGDDNYYVLVRANDAGRILTVRIPSTGYVEGFERPLQGESVSDDYALVQQWLSLETDHAFHWRMDDRALSALSDKLKIQASNIEDFLEGLAVRGLGFLDYWGLRDFVETIEEHDRESSISRAGFAAFLKRIGEGRRTVFVMESMTSYPIRIVTGTAIEPEPRHFLRAESVDSLRQLIKEWQR